MTVSGQDGVEIANGHALHWTRQVVSAVELCRVLNGQRELFVPNRAVITPSAAEELRSRGIRVVRQAVTISPLAKATWCVAQDRPYSEVQSAMRALGREGILPSELPAVVGSSAWQMTRRVAASVARGECRGAVTFCLEAAMVACVANKHPGVRAVVATTAAEAMKSARMFGANFVAVPMPGRTFFEVRQIVKTLCTSAEPTCPPELMSTLTELDGHAHR